MARCEYAAFFIYVFSHPGPPEYITPVQRFRPSGVSKM